MAREHVIPAGAYPAHGHARAAPDVVGLPEPPPPHGEIISGRVEARLALQVGPRHGERRYKHCEAT